MRTILVDNHDSYTFNLAHLMAETFGSEPLVLTNDAEEWGTIDLSRFVAAVISPGPGTPASSLDRGPAVERVLAAGMPTLGVCFGHQAMGWMCGADVTPAPVPRHGHREPIRHLGEDLFDGLPQDFSAVRYHSLCLAEPLPDELEATAWSRDGVIMAIRHRSKPWWGVQFHPESVETEHGARLLRNFARLAGLTTSREPLSLVVRKVDVEADCERVFDAVFAHSPVSFWLDSSAVQQGGARFSFFGDAGGDLGEVLRADVSTGTVDVLSGDGRSCRSSIRGIIFEVLDERIRERAMHANPDLPFDFAGGYVGYFGYELKADLGSRNAHASPHPDAFWMLATRMIAVDHAEKQTWILALTNDAADVEDWVNTTAAAIVPAREPARGGPVPVVEPSLLRPREQYLADIDECLARLRSGESYEICLTNTAWMPFDGSPFSAYLRLRANSPAPHGAYMRFGDLSVLSASPERFIRVDQQGVVEAKPMKGTAARHADPREDAAAAGALRADAKARAENLMIVDLLRNDLGRVCEVGSVSVPHLMVVESNAAAHQLVSTVRGRLRSDLTALDAVAASFPGGSMTGAPKLRTMSILDDLEQHPRGVYSGALGFLALNGTADLSIVIRTAVIADQVATVGSGGAIVLDSDPEAEFDEMILKAAPVLGALTSEP